MTTQDIKIVPDYFKTYTSKIPEGMDLMDALDTYGIEYLASQRETYKALGDRVYDQDKWTVKQVLQHIIDTERIFCYRALRFARADQSPLAGFEHNDYVVEAPVDHRSIDGLLDEYAAVRHSSICLYKSLSEEVLQRHGMASGKSVSVLALGFMTCGHAMHHQDIFEERYYPLIS